MRHSISELICTCFACMLAATEGGCEDEQQQVNAATAGAKAPRDVDAAVLELAPRVRWRTPYVGRLRTLVTAKGVVVVQSRGRDDRSAARRLAGFSVADGRLLWERRTRLRYYDRNAPWTTSHAVQGYVLAYATASHRVQALDVRTGKLLWSARATGGVATAGTQLALATDEEVRVVRPTSGRVARRVSLADPRSGAPGIGLMDGLRDGTLLNELPGGLLLTRNHGGTLQALGAATLSGRWRLTPKDALPRRPDRLAVGARTVLVPLSYPERLHRTRLLVWRQGGKAGAPTLSVVVPGRISRKRTWVTDRHILGVASTATGRALLWRVDRTQGKLLDARPFPIPHFCYFADGVMVCKRSASVSGHSVETLQRRWHFPAPAGQTIRSVRHVSGHIVMEVGRVLRVVRARDGTLRLQAPLRLGEHRYRVATALGVTSGRLVLAARLLDDSPLGDPLLLLALDLRSGKVVFRHRLGRFPREPTSSVDPVDPAEVAPGRLPVLAAPAKAGRPLRILSLFGKHFRVFDVAKGRVVYARGIPGRPGRTARWLKTLDGVAVFRRGKRLFGVDLQRTRVIWQASLWRSRLELATGPRVYLSRRRGRHRSLQAHPDALGRPPESVRKLVERRGCSLRWASSERWFCQDANKLRVLDVQSGTMAHVTESVDNLFIQRDLLLATRAQHKRPDQRPTWLGIDVHTGRERWRAAGRSPATGKAVLPAPFPREKLWPARWTAAVGEQFLVTDRAGRCVYAVDQLSGTPRFRACFAALAGPPIGFRGQILLAARPVADDADGLRANQPLYLLHADSGAKRILFRAGARRRITLGSAGRQGRVLYVTVRSVRGGYTKNELLAVELY